MDRPEALHLPKQDLDLRQLVAEQGISTFFSIWDGVVAAELGLADQSCQKCTIFTITDDQFRSLLPDPTLAGGQCDPFINEPILQRFALRTELVKGVRAQVGLDGADERLELLTVGGFTIVLERRQGQLLANDIPVLKTFCTPSAVLYVLQKVLWIRPEDVEMGIVNLTEGVKLRP